MAFVNFATREITAKIVYYGPGLGGKTTSLQYIHSGLPPDNKGKMISLATEEDRTIYFDFLPLNLGKIQDFNVRVQLYTVPGQVRYNATRKLVLRGADGLVFVADSQTHKKLANVESFSNMEENLRELGKELNDLPHVLQFNKIDLPSVLSLEEMSQLLNKFNVPFFETCATTGIGVLDALKSITKLVFNDLSKKALLQKKSRTTTGVPSTQYVSPVVEKPEPVKAAVAAAAPTITPPPAPPPAPPPPPPPAPVSNYYSGSSGFSSEPEFTEDMVGKIEDTYSELELDTAKDHEAHEIQLESVEVEQGPMIEVEPIAEFDEEPAEDTPFVNPAITEFESIVAPPAIETEMIIPPPEPEIPEIPIEIQVEMPVPAPTSAAPVAGGGMSLFSYSHLFDGSKDLKPLIERFENEIDADDTESAVMTARAIYSRLMSDMYPREYIVDSSETALVFGLGLKFRRFVQFKKLVDSKKLDHSQLLFLHHFLCDLYLSLKEL